MGARDSQYSKRQYRKEQSQADLLHAALCTRWVIVVTRRYRNFAPFVCQTRERKAQTCAKAMLQQLASRFMCRAAAMLLH